MSKKRRLSNTSDEDAIAVLVSCTDVAATALRCEHNQPYLFNEHSVSSSANRPRTAREETPQPEIIPVVKIMLKFSHSPNHLEGLSAGASPDCNIMFENGQQHSASRFHVCFTFDEVSKAFVVSNTSSNGTVLTTRTFLRDDEDSRIMKSSRYDLF